MLFHIEPLLFLVCILSLSLSLPLTSLLYLHDEVNKRRPSPAPPPEDELDSEDSGEDEGDNWLASLACSLAGLGLLLLLPPVLVLLLLLLLLGTCWSTRLPAAWWLTGFSSLRSSAPTCAPFAGVRESGPSRPR